MTTSLPLRSVRPEKRHLEDVESHRDQTVVAQEADQVDQGLFSQGLDRLPVKTVVESLRFDQPRGDLEDEGEETLCLMRSQSVEIVGHR